MRRRTHPVARLVRSLAFTALAIGGATSVQAARLDLGNYMDPTGAITVLHKGPSSDPYFALQALLLAHDNGMDISATGQRFAEWLVPRQKPDGTFDRFCKTPEGWASCKTADADDSLLAMWIRLLLVLPADVRAKPVYAKSIAASKVALARLYQPSRGVYMVAPVTLHGLFMDNLEVWSLFATPGMTGEPPAAELARTVHATFWDKVNRRFMVSTQLEQQGQPQTFYPDAVAQIFPQMVGFPLLPAEAGAHYREWMGKHRKEWLQQSVKDYPWGIIAVLAVNRGDTGSARCWLRQSTPMRHSTRWAVTDEVSYQILSGRGLTPASSRAACD